MVKPPTPRLRAEDWLTAALQVLGDGGVAAVRVEPLAERLGVSKGSFYWHFADRPALLEALLDHWSKVATEAVIARVDREVPEGPSRLDRLLDICLGSRADRVEGAIRAWSAHDARAAEVTAQVDETRERFVARELERLGVGGASARRRSRILYLALIGEFTWCASGGARSDRAVFRELLGLLVGESAAAPVAARSARPRVRKRASAAKA